MEDTAELPEGVSTDTAFWYRVGLLIAVWCVMLVVAGSLLVLFGDGIRAMLF